MLSMRFLYLSLKITLPYSLRVFYRRIRKVNAPKNPLGRTIYVSNHANSFMDPLVVAALRNPIVFFMTRSDIFNKVTQPFLWACQMLPIYREHDGEDTRSKNEEVFKKCTKILNNGRNLLLFGEGFTDDVFIRRLKPVKKGAVKIGFQSLEALNWKKNIYMAAVGVNYTSPNRMRSDVLLSTSDRICLNDYRSEYEENPNKTITTVTRLIENMMQEQITHVENKEDAPLHENIMILTRRGMNVDNYSPSLSLTERWKYSQDLAKWLNKQDLSENEKLATFKENADNYFKLLKRFKLEESYLYWKERDGNRISEILKLVLLFPFAIIGFVHTGLAYFIVKKFVEKSFRRKVFWGSVKLIMGQLLIAIFNIPTIFLFYYFIYPSWWLAVAYFFSIGMTGLAAYMWFINFKRFKIKGVILKTDTSKFWKKRQELIEEMASVVPKEFL